MTRKLIEYKLRNWLNYSTHVGEGELAIDSDGYWVYDISIMF